MELRETILRKVAPALLVASIGVTACGSDNGSKLNDGSVPTESTAPAEVTLSGSEIDRAEELCPEGFGNTMPIAEEFALSRVGSVNSMLPSFSETDANGEVTLAETSEVADVIMERACNEPTFAATMDAIFLQTAGFNEAGTFRLPDETLISNIEETTELFRNNESAMLNSVANLASVILPADGVKLRDDFNVIAGQATLVAPIREGDIATQVGTVEVATEGLFEGYKVEFNLDLANTPQQRETLKQISDLVLINTDGSIIINQWLGANTTDFEVEEESTETTTVETTIDENGDPTPVAPENEDDNNNQDNNGGGNANGENDGPGSDGDNGSTGQPGTGGECSGDRPTPNCEGEGPGPGGPGEPEQPEEPTPGTTTTTVRPTTTTTVRPPTTTVPPTNPPTTPPPTTPPTTSPPTTTQPPATTIPKNPQPATTTTIAQGY